MSGFGKGPGLTRAMTFDERKSALHRKEVMMGDPHFEPLVRRNTTFAEKKALPTKLHYSDVLYRRFFGEAPGKLIHKSLIIIC